MKPSKELLQKYAELIVRTGANVQPGQIVQLTIGVEQHEFAAMVMEECYKAGAKKVNIDWTCDVTSRLNYSYARQEVLELPRYAYALVNDDIMTASAQLESIVSAEKHRTTRYKPELETY